MNQQTGITPSTTVYSNYFDFRRTGLVISPLNFLPDGHTDCPICALTYDGIKVVPVYTACGHLFCTICILRWVRPSFDIQLHMHSFNSTTCPLCRNTLFTVVSPEDDDYQDMLSAELEGVEISVSAMPAPYPLPAVFPRENTHSHPTRRATFSLDPTIDVFEPQTGSLARLRPETHIPRQYRHTSSPPHVSRLPYSAPATMTYYSSNRWTVHHRPARPNPRSQTGLALHNNGRLRVQQEPSRWLAGGEPVNRSQDWEGVQRALANVALSVGGVVVGNGVVLLRREESWHEALDRWTATVAANSEVVEEQWDDPFYDNAH